MLVDVTVKSDPVVEMIAKINGNSSTVKRHDKGIYEIGHFSFDMLLPFKLSYKEVYPELNNSPFGVCDNVIQILEEYPELKDDNRRFCISITPIYKKNQSSIGGWRWHKWGPYIGIHNPQCEYLYDEKDIDMVYVYHIYEFDNEKIL